MLKWQSVTLYQEISLLQDTLLWESTVVTRVKFQAGWISEVGMLWKLTHCYCCFLSDLWQPDRPKVFLHYTVLGNLSLPVNWLLRFWPEIVSGSKLNFSLGPNLRKIQVIKEKCLDNSKFFQIQNCKKINSISNLRKLWFWK